MVQFSNGGDLFILVKDYQMMDSNLPLLVQSLVPCMFMLWLKLMMYLSFFIQTMRPENYFLGLMVVRSGETFFEQKGKSLYSSHMLDLSEEPIEDNLGTCKVYFERMKNIGMTIEIELGVTGGEEDGVDNTNIDSSKLYTQPEEVNQAYEVLSSVSNRFTIAAAFGNVHGVYKPGNVELTPKILLNSQNYIKDKHNLNGKPIHFVFHGGSGSSRNK